MINDVRFLHSIITRLQKAGIETLVFGGWAEELTNIIDPRPHNDVDLFYFGINFLKVDEFLSHQKDLQEIAVKRFSHKRAFLCNDVMVELILLQQKRGRFVTNFWNEYTVEWPELSPITIAVPSVGDIPVVHPSIINFYREHSTAINKVRKRHLMAA